MIKSNIVVTLTDVNDHSEESCHIRSTDSKENIIIERASPSDKMAVSIIELKEALNVVQDFVQNRKEFSSGQKAVVSGIINTDGTEIVPEVNLINNIERG
jgi:hypothetical protein